MVRVMMLMILYFRVWYGCVMVCGMEETEYISANKASTVQIRRKRTYQLRQTNTELGRVRTNNTMC